MKPLTLEAENIQLRRQVESLERIIDEAVQAYEYAIECKENWRDRALASRRLVGELQEELAGLLAATMSS